jgi:hypothetical protein
MPRNKSPLNRRQAIRVGAGVAFAQVSIVDFDGRTELDALRLFGLAEAATAGLYPYPAEPVGTRSVVLETKWDLPSLAPGVTANVDVTVPGARRGDFTDAALDTSSIAFVLDCHVWSNSSVRVTERNVSASTVDPAAAALSVQVTKRGSLGSGSRYATPCRQWNISTDTCGTIRSTSRPAAPRHKRELARSRTAQDRVMDIRPGTLPRGGNPPAFSFSANRA